MTPERWQQVKQIFQSVIERPPDERDAFLARACQDNPALRSEVESLISSHDQAGDSIEAMAAEAATEMLANDRAIVGKHIGHYQVLSSIGRGGMGEVFLAQDTSLGRKVALKLLRSEFTRNEERLRRFRQEARAASALNHPNILTIHEIGQEGFLHFMATEYVEGETLRQRMASAMKLGEALDVAIQVAGALAAAHEAGIVHRDIKPENLMVRRDGYAKVLDFGLAKLTERAPVSSDSGWSTLGKVETNPGVVMGTVQYMAPEQARGLSVDARTDIWSLGCVLYEILAGRAPFEGKTVTDMLVAIVEKEPPPLKELASEQIPADLDWIITKTLRKNPDERYQTSKELFVDLQRLRQKLEIESHLERSAQPEGSSKAVTANVATRATAKRTEQLRHFLSARRTILYVGKRVTRVRAAVLGVVLLVLVAGAVALKKFANRPAVVEETKPAAVTETIPPARTPLLRLTNHPASDELPRWSPNGSRIAFTSNRDGKFDIYLMNPDGSGVTRLTNNEFDDTDPAWSPDGSKIAFTSERDGNPEIYIINADGSGQQRLTADAAVDDGSRWSPDGSKLVFASNRGNNYPYNFDIWTMGPDGGGLKRLTSDPEYDSDPYWSYDGSKITFTSGRDGNFEVYQMNSDGTGQKNLTKNERADQAASWSPNSSVIAFSSRRDGNNEIYLMDGDGENLRRLTDNPGNDIRPSWSPDGSRIVFQTDRDGNLEIYVAEVDDVTRLTDNAGADSFPSWSPDGRQIAFTSNRNGKQAIFVMQADGTGVTQLTHNPFDDADPAWSPDGKQIAFTSKRDGNPEIYVMNSDGSNQRRLTNDPGDDIEPQWSPDGDQILFLSVRAGVLGVSSMKADGSDIERLVAPGGRFSLSPDGKKILYVSQQRPKDHWLQINVSDASGGNVVRLTNNPSNTVDPCWSPDGTRIFLIRVTDDVRGTASVFQMDADGKNARRLTSVAALDRNPAVSPDGSRIAFQSNRQGNVEIYVLPIASF